MNKALLIPIVAFIAYIIKQTTGVTIDNEAIDLGAEVILSMIALFGLFMDPKKKGGDER